MRHIDIPYAIGSEVWFVGPAWDTEYIQCPECLGTKASIVILANGETYSLDCAACAVGYDPPRGVIKRTVCGYKPRKVTLMSVDIRDGLVDYYRTSEGLAKEDQIFETEQDCIARAGELSAQHQAEQDEMAINHLKSKKRSLAFSVHYWRGVVSRLRKELESAEKRIHVCKEREAKKEAQP